MRTIALILLCSLPTASYSRPPAVVVATNGAPQFVFSGTNRVIRVDFENTSPSPVELALRIRLFQIDSAAAMPLGPAKRWKTLRVLGGQTVLETAAITFPDVRATILVEVHWIEPNDGEIGRTRVWVCPQGLLKQLDGEVPGDEIGILDPRNRFKPTLKRLGVGFRDLDSGAGLEDFSGKLAIIGPFFSDEEVPDGLAPRLDEAVKRPLTIVWFRQMPLLSVPNAYLTTEKTGVVAVADARLVKDLGDSPQAQLNLLRCVSWAKNRNLPRMVELATKGSGP